MKSEWEFDACGKLSENADILMNLNITPRKHYESGPLFYSPVHFMKIDQITV